LITSNGGNKAAAGSEGRQWQDGVCYVKNDCDAKYRIEMYEPVQSSNTSYNVREAANALDGSEKSIIHTENKQSGWWKAKFKDGSFKVNQVKLLNRPDGWGARLGAATVEIDGKVCGQVQKETKQNVWYTVVCSKPIIGRTIKVISQAQTPLHFAEIRAFG